jgi:hypothetical protein
MVKDSSLTGKSGGKRSLHHNLHHPSGRYLCAQQDLLISVMEKPYLNMVIWHRSLADDVSKSITGQAYQIR